MYDPVVIEAAKDTTNGDYDRYISQTTGRCVRAVRPGDGKGWRVATGRSNSGKRAVRHLPSWHMRSLAQGSRWRGVWAGWSCAKPGGRGWRRGVRA